MDAFNAFKIYMGLKAHFNSDYDFTKYGGKTRASKSSYLQRKDKHFFGKVARKYGDETQDFFVSNFLRNEKGYIGEFNDRNLLLNQVTDFNKLFTVENGQHPILFRNYLSQRINIETMIILNKLVNYQKDWDKQINENIIWPNHRNKLNNYDSLLTINETEYKMKVLNLTKNKK
jgi:hypothetical protein